MVIPEYQHRDGKALLIVTRPRVFAVNLLCGREQYEELMSGIFKCDLIWMLSFFFTGCDKRVVFLLAPMVKRNTV